MSELPIDQMVKDAELLQDRLVSGEFPRQSLAADVLCHVKALAFEVERLELELKHANNVAHRLADEAREDEVAMRDEMREIEYRAKQEGFQAGVNGGWY